MIPSRCKIDFQLPALFVIITEYTFIRNSPNHSVRIFINKEFIFRRRSHVSGRSIQILFHSGFRIKPDNSRQSGKYPQKSFRILIDFSHSRIVTPRKREIIFLHRQFRETAQVQTFIRQNSQLIIFQHFNSVYMLNLLLKRNDVELHGIYIIIGQPAIL